MTQACCDRSVSLDRSRGRDSRDRRSDRRDDRALSEILESQNRKMFAAGP